jgi:hypothetical protein
MSGERKRWFQIHLSTIVVLTISAGGLLGLNIRPSQRELTVDDLFLPPNPESPKLVYARQGWPFTFWSAYVGTIVLIEAKWRYNNLAVDVAFALGLLGAIAVYCEWQIRRRARVKK